MGDRPAITETMKAEIRKRCGYGCIVCGAPIWDYEHIEEFAVVKVHEVDNIVLLCPTHHAEKTRGMMSKEVVRRFQASPANLGQEATATRRVYAAGIAQIFQFGSNRMTAIGASDGYFYGLWVNGSSLVGVRFEDGFMLLDLAMRDAYGNLVLLVSQGEARISTTVSDVNWVGNTLTIVPADTNILRKVVVAFEGEVLHIKEGLLVDETGSGIAVLNDDAMVIAQRGEEAGAQTGSHFYGNLAGVVIWDQAACSTPPPPGAGFVHSF